ncbi:MAG: YmdB family metallophosphoesterase [Phycisphaerales bacterium]
MRRTSAAEAASRRISTARSESWASTRSRSATTATATSASFRCWRWPTRRSPGRRTFPTSPSAGGSRGCIDRPAPGVFVITVLGRIFMALPANDPFATVDQILASLPEQRPVVIVEAHMEATSEKAALAHHLDGRVAAVIGTHTHVPTADARVLRGGTAFISDVGMCGPYESIIQARREAGPAAHDHGHARAVRGRRGRRGDVRRGGDRGRGDRPRDAHRAHRVSRPSEARRPFA